MSRSDVNQTTLAFDLGGTKIDICRMSKVGRIVERRRVLTAELGPGEPAFLHRAFALFSEHVSESDTKIGLSWNAPVHQERLTQSSLLGGAIEVDLGGLLRERFPDRQVQVESDVHAMALGEFRFGYGAQFSPFVLINLGSGAGFAYHDDRDVMRGHLGGAGLVCQERRWVEEISDHLTMDYLLSGRGVSLLFERLTGEQRPAIEIARSATENPAAQAVFDIIGHHFGHYLATLARMLNPKAFLLAGSVAQASGLFLARASEIADAILEPACKPDRIAVSKLEAPACQGLA